MLDKLFRVPKCPVSSLMRTPIFDIYLMMGVDYVLAGRVEQGQLKLGGEVVLLPTHMVSYMQMRYDRFTYETKSMLIKGDFQGFGQADDAPF
mmetsp:Transcript_88283/g.285151  ORF Transcript_88283/g.285151 Transcript_88283/m.285151 type:complete len:92 (+) Transcript_88283:361-636(+)